jgi:uncharacterized protein (DUF885 family)
MIRRCCPLLLVLLVAAAACNQRTESKPLTADVRITQLADAYLSAYFDRNPDQVTVFGVPGKTHERLPDNSLDALAAWRANEDRWLTEARAIVPASVTTPALRATQAIVQEALEGSVGARVCRSELWNVSQMTGWQVQFGYLVTIQPVNSEAARREALARWGTLSHYLDVEIVNLREGLRQGFSAPKLNVRIVIGQLDSLIDGLAETASGSPFLSPAVRDSSADFKSAFTTLVSGQLLPAFRTYRDFLEREYLPAAREDIAVSAQPDGLSCYDAAVRQFSSLPMPAKEVHELGLRQMDALMAEMRTVAGRAFQTSDVTSVLDRLRSDRRYLFKTRRELIGYSEAALGRARAAAPAWFGLLPKADVTIEAYPEYREKNGSGEYNPPAEDGSRPGLFYISAHQADKKSRAVAESTAFHETIPGHHLQGAIALERTGAHPIGRYLYNSGYAEGWGLYAERLADEMKLYSSDVDRMGMLSSQAFRAARLVVDSGIHTMKWNRQQAIDYMRAHCAEEADELASEVDRYIIMPGQATSYMLGMLEITRARDEAERRMGKAFVVKAFHDRVLEDGAVPLTFLSAKVRSWAAANK